MTRDAPKFRDDLQVLDTDSVFTIEDDVFASRGWSTCLSCGLVLAVLAHVALLTAATSVGATRTLNYTVSTGVEPRKVTGEFFTAVAYSVLAFLGYLIVLLTFPVRWEEIRRRCFTWGWVDYAFANGLGLAIANSLGADTPLWITALSSTAVFVSAIFFFMLERGAMYPAAAGVAIKAKTNRNVTHYLCVKNGLFYVPLQERLATCRERWFTMHDPYQYVHYEFRQSGREVDKKRLVKKLLDGDVELKRGKDFEANTDGVLQDVWDEAKKGRGRKRRARVVNEGEAREALESGDFYESKSRWTASPFVNWAIMAVAFVTILIIGVCWGNLPSHPSATLTEAWGVGIAYTAAIVDLVAIVFGLYSSGLWLYMTVFRTYMTYFLRTAAFAVLLGNINS